MREAISLAVRLSRGMARYLRSAAACASALTSSLRPLGPMTLTSSGAGSMRPFSMASRMILLATPTCASSGRPSSMRCRSESVVAKPRRWPTVPIWRGPGRMPGGPAPLPMVKMLPGVCTESVGTCEASRVARASLPV
jgi:hypothetical protein